MNLPAWLDIPRVDDPELLDLGHGSQVDVAQNLAEMWRLNRYFGGLSALTDHVYPILAQSSEPISILDLGTGGAEIPAAVARWMSQHAVKGRIIGVDWAARNLLAAGQNVASLPEISLLQTDAMRLPFAANSVDLTMSSLFLHHFTREQAVDLLRGAFDCARRAIIMSDLVRGRLPLLAFQYGAPLIVRHHMTRSDGKLSIRRGFTPAELRELATDAGLTNARVYPHHPFRMTLVAYK
ncbi:MAG: methyltransferase domain-containing protein [Burkholderiales bacterium]|nr:methyltransferase domain-containing protein [Anaerolineae bacterium]